MDINILYNINKFLHPGGYIMLISYVRKSFIDFIGGFDWQWHCTLSFVRPVSFNAAKKQFKKWAGRLKQKERLQLAGLGIFNKGRIDNPHSHCLLISKQTPFNKTLDEVDLGTWEKQWPYSCKITARNKWKSVAVSKYLTKEKNLSLYRPDDWDLISFRPSLLKQVRRTH